MLIVVVVTLMVISLLIYNPYNISRFIGQTTVRVTVGVLLLFFFNVFGGFIGLHIPINLFTIAISSILGLFGMTSLVAIHIFLLH